MSKKLLATCTVPLTISGSGFQIGSWAGNRPSKANIVFHDDVSRFFYTKAEKVVLLLKRSNRGGISLIDTGVLTVGGTEYDLPPIRYGDSCRIEIDPKDMRDGITSSHYMRLDELKLEITFQYNE